MNSLMSNQTGFCGEPLIAVIKRKNLGDLIGVSFILKHVFQMVHSGYSLGVNTEVAKLGMEQKKVWKENSKNSKMVRANQDQISDSSDDWFLGSEQQASGFICLRI